MPRLTTKNRINARGTSAMSTDSAQNPTNSADGSFRREVRVIIYFVAGPSSLRSPANSGELRRTRRSLGEGGHPRDLSPLARSLAALLRYDCPLSATAPAPKL